MTQITFIDAQGTARTVAAEDGATLMETAGLARKASAIISPMPVFSRA